MRTARAAFAAAVLALAGCQSIKTFLTKPRYRADLSTSIQAKVAGKKMIAVVYEGVLNKDGKRDSVFRFDQTNLLDKALVELRYATTDRAQIQTMLESQKLPDTGSFKEEDLQRIAASTHADVIVIGYLLSDSSKSLVFGEEKTWRVILRAVDLHTSEVINSAQETQLNDETWTRLARELFRRTDI